MKVHLLHPDRDPAPARKRSPVDADLVHDLGLDTLFDHMCAGDDFLREVAAGTLLAPLTDVDEVGYRQAVAEDLRRRPEIAHALYTAAVSGLESPRRTRGWLSHGSPTTVLMHAVRVLEEMRGDLARLRQIADQHRHEVDSQGLTSLFAGIETNLPDEYFDVLEDHLKRLRFETGTVLTAELGAAGKGTGYTLRKPARGRRTWRDLLHLQPRSGLTYRLPERDEAGARAVSELKDRGINLVADALAQSTEHMLAFFSMLRWEAGFYVCCLNLEEALSLRGLALCDPDAHEAHEHVLTARGLYDLCLGLRTDGDVVGNDVDADGASLLMVTGVNQGGKSTLLRSLGLAWLMTQSGMRAPATQLRASVTHGLFTHFEREEDAGMERGRLDDELARISAIIDQATPGSAVLLNESFSSTNEREGSQIARQVIEGLRGAGVRVLAVTHMFDLAHGLETDSGDAAVFLRPERLEDGTRTFRVLPGSPERTSHGADLYQRLFQGS